MRYVGGKSRIAKNITEVIYAVRRRQVENCRSNFQNDKFGGGGVRLYPFSAAAVPSNRSRLRSSTV